MLVSLSIRDLALVEKVLWLPANTFNVVTGETGAGKSILIGAINIALGARADKTIIRQGAESAEVEAVFELKNQNLKKDTCTILEASGIHTDVDGEQIIIKRIINTSGNSRQWINACSCTLNTLKTLGQMLVDFLGPHDHQSLLSPNTQLTLLDAFAQAERQHQTVSQSWQQWRQAEADYHSLKEQLERRQHDIELLKEHVRLIESAALKPGEDEEISARLAVASKSSRIIDICRTLLGHIEENPDSIQTRIKHLQKLVRELAQIDNSTATQHILSDTEALQVTLQELSHRLCDYVEKIDADPDTLTKLSEKYNLIQLLKKKHGPTIQDVLNFYQHAQSEIARYENREHELAKASAKCRAAQSAYHQAAAKLGELRKKSAPQLAEAIKRELHDLNFSNADFVVHISDCEPGIHGNETVEFLFCPNKGEGMRPLKAIASSGEISRVMLAIKSCLASQDQTPLLIFDEADANIGGHTATRVGRKLRNLSRNHQVLCITHLPQVAAAADTHFVVEKITQQQRTKTSLKKIQNGERVAEIVRMLGGSIDASTLAEQMLATHCGNINAKNTTSKKNPPSQQTKTADPE